MIETLQKEMQEKLGAAQTAERIPGSEGSGDKKNLPETERELQGTGEEMMDDTNPENWGSGATDDTNPENWGSGATEQINPENWGSGATEQMNPENRGSGATEQMNPENRGSGATDNTNLENWGSGATEQMNPGTPDTGVMIILEERPADQRMEHDDQGTTGDNNNPVGACGKIHRIGEEPDQGWERITGGIGNQEQKSGTAGKICELREQKN